MGKADAQALDELKLPPFSAEAEQAVLGCVLQDVRAFTPASRLVQPGAMYVYEHGAVWECMRALVAASQPVDVFTVFEWLRARRLDEKVGGLPYLNQLALCVASPANVEAYARIVALAAQRRRVIQVAHDLLQAAERGGARDEEFAQAIGARVGELADVLHGSLDHVPRRLAELLPGWLDALERRAQGESTAVTLGLRGLDRRLCGGVEPGDLAVLASRPSMGKSAMALGMIRAAAKAGHTVLTCSMEDSAGMAISRHVAALGRTNLEHVRVPTHAPESMWSAVAEATHTLADLPIWIDDNAGLSLQQVVQKAQYVKGKAGQLGLVVVDYLQLMEDEGETRSNELARIARGLKNMAKRLSVPVILLSQLSRRADETNAPPRLDHLAESGGVEQAADIIMLLWREARRNPKPENKHSAQVEVAKNKNGACDTVKLYFDGATQRFEDMSEEGQHGA